MRGGGGRERATRGDASDSHRQAVGTLEGPPGPLLSLPNNGRERER